MGAAAADFRVNHRADGGAGLQKLPDVLPPDALLAVLSQLQFLRLAGDRSGGAVEVGDKFDIHPLPHRHPGTERHGQGHDAGVVRGALAAHPAIQAQQAVGRLALVLLVEAAALQNLRERQLLLQKAQPPAGLPVQHRYGQEALYHQLAANELAVGPPDVHPGGQDLLRAAPARGQGKLLGEGELLLPHASRHTGLLLLPQHLDALSPVAGHAGGYGQGHVAAHGGIQHQIGPGQHLPGIQDPGVDAPQLPPDVQVLTGSVPLSLAIALEGDLKVQGAQALLLLRYVQHRRLHAAAGAEAPVPGQLPAGEAHRAGGVHDPGNVSAAVRHDVLPHGLTGKRGEAEGLIIFVVRFL